MDFEKHYNLLIQRAQLRGSDKSKLDFYSERHHITPRCMGGTDNADNLVLLTAREHYIAHLLLTKIYSDNCRILFAFNMMRTHSGNQARSKNYESNRQRLSAAKRDKEWSKNISIAKTGMVLTDEHKTKISNTLKGVGKCDAMKKSMSIAAQNRTPEHQKALNMANTGKKRTPEAKEKMRQAAKLVKPVVCPHCNKEGNPRAMYRWHFDNCKRKP